MSTKLLRFKVINFRSIEESDWIEVSDNACLVGTNEAGKTNLLIALWKLKPASGEAIRPLADFPRHLYSKYKAENHSEDVFIQADFQLDDKLATKISATLECEREQVRIALVERKYNGSYIVSLPYSKIDFIEGSRIKSMLETFSNSLNQNEVYVKEADWLKEKISTTIQQLIANNTGERLEEKNITNIIQTLRDLITNDFGKKQNLPALFEEQLLTPLSKIADSFAGKPINITEQVQKLIIEKIPAFVFYSDYGNLDSEIYLPRVIEDMDREDLTETARAKARTLDVLFKYVNLSPQEIYELGNDRKVIIQKVNHVNNQVISSTEENLTPEQVAEWAEKKKERAVLLKSASSELTKNFKQWWQQGNYIFSFEADGSHFRINVSDELRPESIELEGRSRGLQWFFSFFLVFLVETKGEHENAILLLDEPGLSLHPIAQYDLSKFFRKLSENNQLVYTSHSPFLVDMENLSNVKAVYIDSKSGRTKISSNLRHNETDAEKSIYPVHAALGLTVSDTLLLGCQPVLVEGVSDQIYLTVIKRYLIGKGLLKNSRELVFIPTGGVKGMNPVTKLVASREGKLPFALLDSDKAGKEHKNQLYNGLYREQKDRVLEVNDFRPDKSYEIEDLLPAQSIIEIIDRAYRGNTDFADSYQADEPIVDQIEKWANDNNIQLVEGWKVEVAKQFVNKFDRLMKDIPETLEKGWEALFQKLLE